MVDVVHNHVRDQSAVGCSISSGSDEVSDSNVLIDNLTDKEKSSLYQGDRRLLFGRFFERNSCEVSRKPLFELKTDDEKVNWSIFVRPKNEKDVRVHESYSAVQQSLTESSYLDASVQCSVAEVCGGSLGYSNLQQQETINTKTSLWLTAETSMTKGELITDEDCVRYSENFLREVNKLVSDEITSKQRWEEFMQKYGQFYISQCYIGGAAYSSKKISVRDNKQRDTAKHEFQASFEASIGAAPVEIGGSFARGQERHRNHHNAAQVTAMSLKCRGGNPAKCSRQDFGIWEHSVNTNYQLWAVTKVTRVRPFYHLLDDEKQRKIRKLMPRAETCPPTLAVAPQWGPVFGTDRPNHRPVSDKQEFKGKIAAVRVCDCFASKWLPDKLYPNMVASIAFKVNGEWKYEFEAAGKQGDSRELALADDEWIVKVETRCGDHINWLKMWTNKDRVIEGGGRPGGEYALDHGHADRCKLVGAGALSRGHHWIYRLQFLWQVDSATEDEEKRRDDEWLQKQQDIQARHDRTIESLKGEIERLRNENEEKHAHAVEELEQSEQVLKTRNAQLQKDIEQMQRSVSEKDARLQSAADRERQHQVEEQRRSDEWQQAEQSLQQQLERLRNENEESRRRDSERHAHAVEELKQSEQVLETRNAQLQRDMQEAEERRQREIADTNAEHNRTTLELSQNIDQMQRSLREKDVQLQQAQEELEEKRDMSNRLPVAQLSQCNEAWKGYELVLRSQSDDHEPRVVLPQCLPTDANLLPYTLSFRIEFLTISTAGYHGGFYFGSNDPTRDRWRGHTTLEEKADVTVVDCYFERNQFRVYGAAGLGPDNEIRTGDRTFEQLNDKKWEIVFDRNNRCSFYHDGVLIERNFTAVGVGGCLGFWVYHSGAMRVHDLRVGRLFRNSSRIKLKHGVGRLRSQSGQYIPGSQRQRVSASGPDSAPDDNEWFEVKTDTVSAIRYGDDIRLQHVLTGHYLYSSDEHVSPVTQQQEVSCQGVLNDNSLWRVVLASNNQSTDFWRVGDVINLIHRATNNKLHSHDLRFPDNEQEREVTCFAHSDAGDNWACAELI